MTFFVPFSWVQILAITVVICFYLLYLVNLFVGCASSSIRDEALLYINPAQAATFFRFWDLCLGAYIYSDDAADADADTDADTDAEQMNRWTYKQMNWC